MASVQKQVLRSLQIGCTETSQGFQKKRGTETLHALLNPFSVTPFQGISQMGTNLPYFSPVLFVVVVVLFLWGRRLEDVRELGGEKWLALPGSEWPCIKGGLLLKKAEDGWKRSQGSQFPRKRLNRDFCVSFMHYPKCNYRFRKDHSNSTEFEDINWERSLLERQRMDLLGKRSLNGNPCPAGMDEACL